MDTLHAEITEYILNEFLPGEDPSVLTGDVERYMRTLRLLSDLRGRSQAIA